jgi:eukaryotic-like serine/threonine-protein kinase
LFRMVTDEAERNKLASLLAATIVDNDQFLTDLAKGAETENLRDTFLRSESRMELEQYVSQRLHLLAHRVPDKDQAALFSSMFVLDAQGNNLGISFLETKDRLETSPVARNFAYRSYFTGQRADLSPTADRQPPTEHAHFSASFRSTSTGKWKVGISCPIWPKVPESDAAVDIETSKRKPLGVLVLTINLGDFQLLAGESDGGDSNRLAVLVDGRDGNQQGTLLQHPLLTALATQASSVRDATLVPPIDPPQLAKLRAEGMRDYHDPAAQHPDGKLYEGEWIAAIQQVALPSLDERHSGSGTDLWVLVQERASRAQDPVHQLGNRLQNESMIALITVVLVICVLWYFVFRLSEVREFSPAGSAAPNALNYPVLKSTVDHD